MTAEEIKEYVDLIGKKVMEKDKKTGQEKEVDAKVTLHGYTSTSLLKSSAKSFVWEDTKTGHQKVLFHFKWMSFLDAYFLDAGAFDHEEEVLLFDGAKLIVESVEEIKNDKLIE